MEPQRGSSPSSQDSERTTVDSTLPSSEKAVPEPPPNGGYGWVVTVCTAAVIAHTWGINASFGVFLNHYLSSDVFPGATYLDYAFVGGLSIGVTLFIAPLATITTRKFGTRTTLLIGTVVQFGSLLGASFATRTWHLFLTQGASFGLGMGFLFVGSIGLIPQWFTTRRSLANGIAASGAGFGGLIYSLATEAMLRNLDLAWAFRILAILAIVVNGTCSLLIRDRNKIIGSSQLAFDGAMFKRVEFLLVLAFGFFSMLGYVVLLFSLASYAHNVGLTAQQASTVLALLNLGQALGRPLTGYFSDTVGRINMASFASLLCGLLAFVLWIFSTSYGLLIFYAIAGGAVAGTFWAVIGPVTSEVVGLKHVPSGLTLVWVVVSFPATFSEAIGLEIVNFDHNNYIGAQIFVGAMYIAAGAALLMLRGWKIAELDAFAARKSEGAEGVDSVSIETVDDDLRAYCRERGRKRILADMLKLRKV